MHSARKMIDDLARLRKKMDRDILKFREMKTDAIAELEKFVPRDNYERKTKMDEIRRLQVSLVENGNAGNVKFYTAQLLAKEEEKERGLSDTQRKLAEMTKELKVQKAHAAEIDYNKREISWDDSHRNNFEDREFKREFNYQSSRSRGRGTRGLSRPTREFSSPPRGRVHSRLTRGVRHYVQYDI